MFSRDKSPAYFPGKSSTQKKKFLLRRHQFFVLVLEGLVGGVHVARGRGVGDAALTPREAVGPTSAKGGT